MVSGEIFKRKYQIWRQRNHLHVACHGQLQLQLQLVYAYVVLISLISLPYGWMDCFSSPTVPCMRRYDAQDGSDKEMRTLRRDTVDDDDGDGHDDSPLHMILHLTFNIPVEYTQSPYCLLFTEVIPNTYVRHIQ